MNHRNMFLLIAIAFASVASNVGRLLGIEGGRTNTPNMPHHNRHGHRTRARVPNDGHWHMKFHRSRS